MRRLSPLNSLRSFEAAARWLSFSKASEELFVTPAAVSQQIKQLESYLGVVLFRRTTRAVHLTSEARTVLPLLTEGFDKLAEAVELLAREEETGLLTVSTVPTFAAKWLLQRLPDFSEKYPDIDLRLDATLARREFDRDSIDISISLSMGDFPGFHVSRIFDEEVCPVCSPELLTGENPLRAPEDLKYHHLLHLDSADLQIPLPDWCLWASVAGVENINPGRGSHFTVQSMAIEAAINGNGVALVSHYAVAEDLKAGRLVRPFDLVLPADFSYWLVCPYEHLRRAKVKAFHDWLLDQAAKDTSPIWHPL